MRTVFAAAALDAFPPEIQNLLGDYEGLRGYELLPNAQPTEPTRASVE